MSSCGGMAIQALESGCPLVGGGGGMAILDRNLGVLLYLKAKKKNYGNSNISSWQKY